MRCLETAAQNGQIAPFEGDTNIFIYPGYRFNVVDGLLTNFHLSESTLIMLVSAFAGYQPIMAAYTEAIIEHYRFFRYGDAMFLLHNPNADQDIPHRFANVLRIFRCLPLKERSDESRSNFLCVRLSNQPI